MRPWIWSSGSMRGSRSKLSTSSAREREYWRCHVVDLIAAERERLAALVEEKHKETFELLKNGS